MEIGVYEVVSILAFFKGAWVSLEKVLPLKSPRVILWAFLFGGAVCAISWPVWLTWKAIKAIQGKHHYGLARNKKRR